MIFRVDRVVILVKLHTTIIEILCVGYIAEYKMTKSLSISRTDQCYIKI